MKPVYTLVTILLGFIGLIMPLTLRAELESTDAAKLERVYAEYADYAVAFPAVTDISATDAMRMIKSGRVVRFVDTRRDEEMAVSMLPGAISKKMFLDNDSTVDREAVVIVYCTIGYRSGIFARDLAERGREIYNLKGGLLAWVLEGGTVYDRDGVSRRIHVYGDTWKLAPKGYETIVFPFWKQFLPFQ